MAIANTGSRRRRGIPSCGDLVYGFGVSCARGAHMFEDHLKCRWLSECKLIETNWLVQMPQIERVIFLLNNENNALPEQGIPKVGPLMNLVKCVISSGMPLKPICGFDLFLFTFRGHLKA